MRVRVKHGVLREAWGFVRSKCGLPGPSTCVASPLLSPAAANVHYVTGRTFSAWVRESGLQAGEQIRIRKEAGGGRVVIQRVPADRKVGCGQMERNTLAG